MKLWMYDGGIRVPLLARWPGKIAPGGVTDHISAFWDFLPTACELAGAELPTDIDGISYLPTLLGNKDQQRQHEYLYWEYSGRQAVRLGKWKAVRFPPNGRIELYDLQADLGESNDVSAANPVVVERIKRIAQTAHVELP